MRTNTLLLLLLTVCFSLPMRVTARPMAEEEIQDVLANPENLTALLQGLNGEQAAEMIGSLMIRISQMPDPSARPPSPPPPPRRFRFFRRSPIPPPPPFGMSLAMQTYSVASYVTRAMEVLGPEQSGIMMTRLLGIREIPDRFHATAMAATTLVAHAVTAAPETTQQGESLMITLREIGTSPDTPEIVRSANANPVSALGTQVVERLSRDFPVIQRGVTAFAVTQVPPPAPPTDTESDEPAPGDDPAPVDDPAETEEAPVAPEAPQVTAPSTQQTTAPVQIVQPPPITLDDEPLEPPPTGPTTEAPPVIPTPYAGQS